MSSRIPKRLFENERDFRQENNSLPEFDNLATNIMVDYKQGRRESEAQGNPPI
jgi:hypothetical protein